MESQPDQDGVIIICLECGQPMESPAKRPPWLCEDCKEYILEYLMDRSAPLPFWARHDPEEEIPF